jgi:leucyl aminopeptidase
MSPDPKFANELLLAASAAGEKAWQVPLEKNYMKLMESSVADLRNIATVRYGGSITAGLFLSAFVPEGTRWAHLDIAGPAFASRAYTSYLGKGATGYGVRTLIAYIQESSK